MRRPLVPAAGALVLAAAFGGAWVIGGSVSSVSLQGASPGVTVSITGTGFDASAAANSIAFTSRLGGVRTVAAATVATVDAARGIRRLSVAVPSGLPVGAADLRITNTATQEITDAGSLQILRLDLVDVASAPAGASNVAIRLQTSGNASLASGTVRAGFGAGITVVSTVVNSPTTATATITIAASAAAGARTVTLQALNQTLTATNAFQVMSAGTPVNHAPVPSAGGPYRGRTAAAIMFDGKASSDPDGDPLEYHWDFGDGSSGDGDSPSHAFANAGTYQVTLTVTDSRRASAVSVATATVEPPPPPPPNRPPTVRAGGPYSGVATQALAFAATADDPDQDSLTFSWTFGDGQTGTGAAPSHTYGSAGEYTATVTVQDGRGGSASATANVVVGPAPPPPPPPNRAPAANAGGPYTAILGQPVVFAGAATDPDGDTIVFTWAFGDAQNGSGASPSHAYSTEGQFTATLTADDGHGGTASSTAIVTVTAPPPPPNRPPTASAGGPYTSVVSQSVTFAGSASDADSDPLTYTWSFGDGQNGTGAAPSHSYPAAGSFTATLTVTDGRGGVATVTATVTVTAAPAPENHAPSASAGGPYAAEAGIAIAFAGSASDADGDALTYTWDFGDGEVSHELQPSHAFGAAGPFTVTFTASDGRGGSRTATTTATITAAVDRVPPVVSLRGAREALPGAQIVVTADASDNVGVTAVTFTVNGGDPVAVTAPPYRRTVTLPEFAAAGATVQIAGVARDAAGNVAAAKLDVAIASTPDSQPPAIQLRLPASTAPGAAIKLSAIATDNTAVAAVVFSANGTSLATVTAEPYETTYQVPLDAPVGSSLTFTAQANDATGNHATSSGVVAIAQTADTTAPHVEVSAPPAAIAGTPVRIASTATDDSGVATVRLFVDGAQIASLPVAPFEASFTVPAASVAGTRLRVEARAADFTGLESSAFTTIDVVAPAQGVLTGEVYDDDAGLPLSGATVRLTGVDSRGLPYSGEVLTDETGRYVLGAAVGTGIVRINKNGWSAVDRTASVVPGRAIELVDARLTRSAAAAPLAALQGGVLTGSGAAFVQVWRRELAPAPSGLPPAKDAKLAIPAGALAADATLALSATSRQALAGLLPAGWTPIAIVDVAPHGLAIPGSTLSVPVPFDVRAGVLAFVRWDDAAEAWRTVAPGAGVEADATLAGAVETTGQYAWVLADIAPQAPPSPAAGQLLAGVARGLVPDSVSGLVTPQPRILFYKPGVKSDVRGTLQAPALVSSGTIIKAGITESYRFISSAEARPESFEQDVVLYQVPEGATTMMSAGFPVSPSLAFDPLSLQQGVISVELRAPGAALHEMDVVGAAGGTVTGPSGERLEIVPGSVTSPGPVELGPIANDAIGIPIPDGFVVAGAVTVRLSDPLASSATLSIALPSGTAPDDLILLTRLQDLGGRTRFVLVAAAGVVNARLISSTTLAGSEAVFPGIREAGRYVFLRATVPAAFAAGTLTGPAGVPFAGGAISNAAVAIDALSQSTGLYVAAIGLGPRAISAIDLLRRDSGAATTTATAPRQVVPMNLQLTARPPTVVSVTPGNGAVDIAPADPVVIQFSSPIDPATATLQNVRLTSSAGAILGTLALSSDNTRLTLRPAAALAPNTLFTVSVSASVADRFGRQLPAPVSTTFTSLDTVAPPPPPAGAIRASIPGSDGKTTIVATQGTAGTHDTVMIRNATTGALTPVVLDPNGGFQVIVAAGLADKLQLLITDAAGNRSVTALPRFRRDNADGSISEAVGADAARVLGPGCSLRANGTIDGASCVVVDVPAGAFATGATLTLKPVAASAFPITLTPEQAQFLSYTGGFQIDLGGATPATYLNVSVAAGPSDTQVDRWIVGQVMDTPGGRTLNVVDTARLIDGRVATSSPPCPGVTGTGVYGFLKSARPVAVTFASLQSQEGATFNAYAKIAADFSGGSSGAVGMPYSGTLEESNQALLGLIPRQVCMPVLSGRVTIGGNRFSIPAPATLFPVEDEEVIVENQTRGSKLYFYRPFPTAFSVEGNETDVVKITVNSRPTAAVPAGGTRLLTSAACTANGLPADCIKPLRRSWVTVEIPASEFVLHDRSVTVENVRTKARVGLAFVDGRGFYDVKLLIEGEATDTYVAQVADKDGRSRTATPGPPVSYAFGAGSLLLRGVPGAVDPTRPEIVSYNAHRPPDTPALDENDGVGRVTLRATHPDKSVTTYLIGEAASLTSRLVTGGFLFAFDGSLGDRYELQVEYENGNVDKEPLPNFHIIVTDAANTVRRTIIGPAPPPNDTLVLDVYGDDGLEPRLLTDPTRLIDFDPGQPLKLVFAAPLLKDNLSRFAVYDNSTGEKVAGEAVLSQRDTVLTFVPANPLKLGSAYRISLTGQTDLLGHPLKVRSLPLATFTPRKLSTYREPVTITSPPVSFADLALYRPSTSSSSTSVFLTAVAGERGTASTRTIDVTDPAHPVKVGQASTNVTARRVTIDPLGFFSVRKHPAPDGSPYSVAGCSEHIPGGRSFVGALAVVSSYTTNSGHINFLDVTDPLNPCLLGVKILSANPETKGPRERHGTVSGMGAARGVATIHHSAGVAAYMAQANVGLFAVDVGANVPEVDFNLREQEGFYAGDFRDVLTMGSYVFGANASFDATGSVDVFDASLSQVTSVPINVKPRRMVSATGVRIDKNGDGQIGSGEIFDLLFVGGIGGIDILDATNGVSPSLIAHINTAGIIRELAVAGGGRRLYAGGDRTAAVVGDEEFFIFDVANPFRQQSPERLLYDVRYPGGIFGIQGDDERGLAYVAFSKGIDIYTVDPPNVTGVITYVSPEAIEDPAIYGKGLLDFAHETERPVRGAIVELRDATNRVIATTNTNEGGYYAFSAPRNSVVSVVVKAALGDPRKPSVQVENGQEGPCLADTPDCFVYKHRFDFLLGAGAVTKDYKFPSGWNATTKTLDDAKRESGPFAILDSVREAQTFVEKQVGAVTLPKLVVKWKPGLYDIPIAGFDAATNAIGLRGDQTVDTDEFDDAVVFHEWAHYLVNTIGRSDSLHGDHAPLEILDPTVSFNEAFANAFAGMVLQWRGDGTPPDLVNTAMDTRSLQTSFVFHLDNDTTPDDRMEPTGNLRSDGYYSEVAVGQVIFDLFDSEDDGIDYDTGTAGYPDTVALGFKPLYNALVATRNSPAFNTLYSFLDALKAANPAAAAGIDAIANAENIPPGNAYEEPGTFYTGLSLTNALSASVHDTFVSNHPPKAEDMNRLLMTRYFKFSIATAGCYVVKVETAPVHLDPKLFLVELNLKGVSKNPTADTTAPGGSALITRTFTPGDYAVRVRGTEASQFIIRVDPCQTP